MTTNPGEGERRAISGYHPQYLVSASLILKVLQQGDLEWIRIADPEITHAVDDIMIATVGRVDAYQVKWSQYGGSVTFQNITKSTGEELSLIGQLSEGWKELKDKYPDRRIVVHLFTNRIPAYTSTGMPKTKRKPKPYTLSAFFEQSWLPSQEKRSIVNKEIWNSVWSKIQEESKLEDEEFGKFILDCQLDFSSQLPTETDDLQDLFTLLISSVGSPERIIQLSSDEILNQLGWGRRYRYRSPHVFPAPQYLYRPISLTVENLNQVLNNTPGGYVGVLGPPGSGKSTFLSQTLRKLSFRTIKYYSYVPGAQDPSILRGESINFFHDVTLRIQKMGIGEINRPDPNDRLALLRFFHNQLQLLGEEFKTDGIRTIILIDGLDHISREQKPERSFLKDLPIPEAIPPGVYIILGSQTFDLDELPPTIRRVFSNDDLVVRMERLTPTDINVISDSTFPDLTEEEKQKIYQLTDGYPLALIYILNLLVQSKSTSEYSDILEESIPYSGDIDEHYFAHWTKIEGDSELSRLLGLLARIRGPIHMNWISQWVEEEALHKLKQIFLQYFSCDSQDRWEFFHNSFRLFIIDKTTELYPGMSKADVNQIFHKTLANKYEDSPSPWTWEKLYHHYQAMDYTNVVEIATYSWFRNQVESLRPIDSIETDIKLAIKAAGEVVNPKALFRFTVIGASMQQRSYSLENTSLPLLLLKIGDYELAIDHSRDGANLLISDIEALKLSGNFFDAGLIQEGFRIFELAEPLEYLSGRVIKNDHSLNQDFDDLLEAWVENAILYRSIPEICETIRRIQLEPSPFDKDIDISQSSLNIQNRLIFYGALACCDRKDIDGWYQFFDCLDEKRDQPTRFYILLRSSEKSFYTDLIVRSVDFFQKLSELDPPKSIDKGRYGKDNCLSIAELALNLKIDNGKSVAKKWLDKIGPIPLSDDDGYSEQSPKLFELQFRYARLRFQLDKTLTPIELLKTAEEVTNYRSNEDGDTILARRQLNLVVINIAKMYTQSGLDIQFEPAYFIGETKWIFDLLEDGWSSQSAIFRLEVSGVKSEIARYLIDTASRHGQKTLLAVKEEFERRWNNSPANWGVGTQRDLIIAFYDSGIRKEWIKSHLERIELSPMRNLELYERIEQCEKQAKAWLLIGEIERTRSLLSKLVITARGIYHDEDYQLEQWAEWLQKVNINDPSESTDRIRLFLRRLLSNDNIPGFSYALLVLIRVIFDLSPNKAIQFYKQNIENKYFTHQNGLVSLIDSALLTSPPPIKLIYIVILELLIPLVRQGNQELVTEFIIQSFRTLGESTTIEYANNLMNQTKIYSIENQRKIWLKGIYDGLVSVNINPDDLGIFLYELEENTDAGLDSLDRNLYLKDKKILSLSDALNNIQTIKELRKYIEKIDSTKSNYFEWHIVGQSLIENTSTKDDLWEISDLIKSHVSKFSHDTELPRFFTRLSKRFFDLGLQDEAEKAIEIALKLTKYSGWAINWDGGARYEVMKQIISLYGEESRDRLIRLYAVDLSDRFYNPEHIMRNSIKVAEILFDEIPYNDIWKDIDSYMDELFAGTVVDPIQEIETLLDREDTESSTDEPENALINIITLYLDFPAYPVSNRAIRACCETIQNESKVLENSLKEYLVAHDQVIIQTLKVLEVVSLIKPDVINAYKNNLENLLLSPNLIIRRSASTILTNILGTEIQIGKIDGRSDAFYSLHLPDNILHKTFSVPVDMDQPILVGDWASMIRPLDIEARILATMADVSEKNVIFRTAQIYKQQFGQRTWLSSISELNSDDLTKFLDRVDLRFSQYRPNISPARNALAHVAGELYDLGFLSPLNVEEFFNIFDEHDPSFFIIKSRERPDRISRIGGLDISFDKYMSVPKGWEESAEESSKLLEIISDDGRIILGEWTNLRYLDDNWPTEYRMSFHRACKPNDLWKNADPNKKDIPFESVLGVKTEDYLSVTKFSSDEMIIAHNGYRYQSQGANWIGLNPALGLEMDWKPSDKGLFQWLDKNDEIVVESIWWEDGPYDLYSPYGHVEVGNGWLVLITESGLKDIFQRFNDISRGGKITRSLGWLESKNRFSVVTDLPIWSIT